MFKIESYITPIILSHVDKYVKNIRPQDSQVICCFCIFCVCLFVFVDRLTNRSLWQSFYYLFSVFWNRWQYCWNRQLILNWLTWDTNWAHVFPKQPNFFLWFQLDNSSRNKQLVNLSLMLKSYIFTAHHLFLELSWIFGDFQTRLF